MTSPRQAAAMIRAAILRRPDLRYRGAIPPGPDPFADNPYKGFCYVATEVFCFLTGAQPWQGYDGMHYWAMLGDERWDLTAEQFAPEHLPGIYRQGRPTRFSRRPGGLSKRAQALYEEAQRGAVAA